MSIWWQRKNRSGQTESYAVQFPFFALLMLVGMLLALLMAAIQMLRAWFGA